MRLLLSSKIHKAIVTEANLDYIGSITIDQLLLDAVDLWAVQRLETYIISGERGSGVICMNGAAAHLIKKNHEIIIMGFQLSDSKISPKCILVNKHNKIEKLFFPHAEYLEEKINKS